MVELSRRVRFGIDLRGETHAGVSAGQHNTFAGWPPLTGLGVYCELEVTCRGQADPVTGYMMNISAIDAAVRRHAIPIVERSVRAMPSPPPEVVLRAVTESLDATMQPALAAVRWWVTPYYSLIMTPHSTDRIAISQQFEFAAAHRLHCASLTDDENKRTFGKCNNAHGHGHNYRLEPLVEVPLNPNGNAATLALPDLERIVNETIIQRFDHANLNLDLPEFEDLNPSVENIARVCYDLLQEPITRAGGRLLRITIWETEKTRCTYPAPNESTL